MRSITGINRFNTRASSHQWKTSCPVMVPKNRHPKVLNDYNPVALTSLVMKTLDLSPRPLFRPALNPLQFA